MEELLTVHPLSFMPITTSHKEHGDEIIIPQRILQTWMEQYPPGAPLLATVTNPDNDAVRTVCIGSGLPEGISQGTERCAYMPAWIMDHLGVQGGGVLSITPVLTELPLATKLTIRPLDNAAYHTDLRAAVEAYLDMFHILEPNTTLSVPLEELGGYEVMVFIETTEPSALVRLGGEVIIEFCEPEGGIPELDESVSPSHQAEELDKADEPEATAATESVIEYPSVNPVVIPVQTLTTDEKELIRLARLKKFGGHLASAESPSGSVPQTSGST
jgi:hypothetical protein